MRNPAHDPLKGDVLVKHQGQEDTIIFQEREVMGVRTEGGRDSVIFTDIRGIEKRCSIPSWRKWAKDAVIEHMATKE